MRSASRTPEGYRRAAQRLGFDVRETLILEDAPAGLGAGHAAGARVIAVATYLGADALTGEDWIPDFTTFAVETVHGGGGLHIRVGAS